jgi:DNA-binding NtrC family response regulator
LKVVPIYIPPLRERREDILVLSKHFLNMYNMKFNKAFQGISEDCSEALLNYQWPGNIRELKNMLERVVLLEDGDLLKAENLPIVNQSIDHSLSAVRRLENTLVRNLPDEGVEFDKLISDVEVDLIVKASRQCNWNQSRTAELLQMKRDKLRYRMKIYNIESERKRGPGRPAQDDGSADYDDDDQLDGDGLVDSPAQPEAEAASDLDAHGNGSMSGASKFTDSDS